MPEPLDPNNLVSLEELALSSMWEIAALVEVLERKGVLTKQDVLDMIQELRQREPTGRPPRRRRREATDVSGQCHRGCSY